MVASSGISRRCQEGCRWRLPMETNSSISWKAAIRHVKLAANRMVAGSGISRRCQEGCRWRLPMETNSNISWKAASCSSSMPPPWPSRNFVVACVAHPHIRCRLSRDRECNTLYIWQQKKHLRITLASTKLTCQLLYLDQIRL
jgi:hypothetical protein